MVAAAGVWLAACSSTSNLSTSLEPSTTAVDAYASAPPDAGSETDAAVAPAVASGMLGSDPNDDLSLGKKQYRANNYGLAEKYFRRAVESHPRDAEAWLGLAASYDRLRRFDLADRAYAQAIGIVGPTLEILNNQGYSYMLRGDYKPPASGRELPQGQSHRVAVAQGRQLPRKSLFYDGCVRQEQ